MRVCKLMFGIAVVGVMPLALVVAGAQSFETASVKPNRGGGPPGMEIRVVPSGAFVANNAPLRTLVRESHRVQDYQIVGLPAWADSERFDINARGPETSTGPVEWQPMVQALLQDRFKLVSRRENRDMPMFAAVAVRAGQLGPRLRATSEATAAYCQSQRLPPAQRPAVDPAARVCGMQQSVGTVRGTNVSLAVLWRFVSQQAGRAVVDRSGLSGNFDFDLTWTPEMFANRETPAVVNGNTIDPHGPSLFTAVQEQLGLKLDAQRGPVEMLIVERIERPTED